MVAKYVDNEFGKVYNDLTVIGLAKRNHRGDAYLLCRCICGKETVAKRGNLQNGSIKSCGCRRKRIPYFKDLTGQRFGKLLVISRHSQGKNGHTYFLCKCDCGKEKIIPGHHIIHGKKTKSCGCLWVLDEGESAFNSLYEHTKKGASERSLEWDLSKEYFREITKKNCHYCGIEPKQGAYKKSRTNGKYLYNGIDRVDNRIGYIVGNCVPCCGKCNRLKMAMSVEDFKSAIVSIYKHWASH